MIGYQENKIKYLELKGSRMKVRVGSGTSEEFEVRVGVHQGSVLSPQIFAFVVDVVIEHVRKIFE